MAAQPCTYCGRVPRGRLTAFIWAWYGERDRIAVKTRSCSACIEAATRSIGTALLVDGDYYQLRDSCGACEEPMLPTEARTVFLT
jgi:hypothetical protein